MRKTPHPFVPHLSRKGYCRTCGDPHWIAAHAARPTPTTNQEDGNVLNEREK